MDPTQTLLIVVDLQDKLINVMRQKENLIKNTIKTITACKEMKVKSIKTEQNPAKLGKTIQPISTIMDCGSITKMSFSVASNPKLKEILEVNNIKNVVLVGLETHICVQQTAIELLNKGLHVYICVDAVSSRYELDHQISLYRMSNEGVKLTTVEAFMFDICKTSDRREFKVIRDLAKE